MVVHQNITNLAGYFHFLNVRKIPYVIHDGTVSEFIPSPSHVVGYEQKTAFP